MTSFVFVTQVISLYFYNKSIKIECDKVKLNRVLCIIRLGYLFGQSLTLLKQKQTRVAI